MIFDFLSGKNQYVNIVLSIILLVLVFQFIKGSMNRTNTFISRKKNSNNHNKSLMRSPYKDLHNHHHKHHSIKVGTELYNHHPDHQSILERWTCLRGYQCPLERPQKQSQQMPLH